MNNQNNTPENGAACGQSTASCSTAELKHYLSFGGGVNSVALYLLMEQLGMEFEAGRLRLKTETL